MAGCVGLFQFGKYPFDLWRFQGTAEAMLVTEHKQHGWQVWSPVQSSSQVTGQRRPCEGWGSEALWSCSKTESETPRTMRLSSQVSGQVCKAGGTLSLPRVIQQQLSVWGRRKLGPR